MKHAAILYASALMGVTVTASHAAKAPVIAAQPVLPVVAQSAGAQAPPVMPPALATKLVSAHNRERQGMGMPPLAWDEALAVAAKRWAVELARSGRFEHSPQELRGPQGENLFMGTAGAYSLDEMMDDFLEERRDFTPGTFPDVARDGSWHNVGHYTQIIWRKTRGVGCAMARGNGQDYLVCRYWPAGNVMGQRVP